MRRAAYTVTWRNGVDMAIRDIPATGIVATMVTLMEVITGEGTIIPTTTTTGLITGAIMAIHHMAIHHIDTTAGPMDSGSAAIIKNRKRIRAEARGSGGVSNYAMSPLLPDFVRM